MTNQQSIFKLFLFSILTQLLFAFSALALEANKPYLNGEKICASINSNPDKKEFGRWVEVPVDYADASLGTTGIYTWTYKSYDTNLPTLIYFHGGPGAPVHMNPLLAESLPQWNIVYFDQRGVACSRPSSESLLLDEKYYSSEATARDAQLIAKAFAAKQWSAYGHSYGTVPATMAAHFFPGEVRSLLLEGVVFDGSVELWQSDHRRKLLQRYFNSLPIDLQKKILQWSQTPEVPPGWFAEMARSFMYSANYASEIRNYLDYILSQSESDQIQFLKVFNGQITKSIEKDNEYGGTFSFLYLVCKELSGWNPASDWALNFVNGILTPAADPGLADICQSLKIPAINTYDSRNYPVEAPVTYINGTTDGATPAPNAVNHYKQTARKKAQLLLVLNSGHFPVKDLLEAKFPSELLSKAAHGIFLEDNELKAWPQIRHTKKP